MADKPIRDDLKLSNLLPPLFICLVIGTIWSVYTCLHLLPLLQIGVPAAFQDVSAVRRGSLQAMISQLLVSLFLTCYTRACLTSPGEVPDTPEWRLGSAHVPSTREVKNTGERRICKWCMKYKPDRCHHCRVCKTCVLKMDHHCPWIMNCVGWGNHKFFFLVVVYAATTCTFIFFTVLESVAASVDKDMPHLNRFLLVLCMMLAFIMGTLMIIFLGFHTCLMLRAMTTIEFCEKGTMVRAAGTPNYDRGVWENVTQVLGPRPLLWLLPTDPARGDGMHFGRLDD
eukprot:CAMPEP_0115479998 /NCGR_PEP_ID=MMETSP0271-20121206/57036_1 /TAXON_ID=71861 /ORGANISM="Scrippsiella trochoidea, Strain CCMP3099" /LENGTH=283 /DNA_ID=CAMNT_0002907649 /DNA_START=75 /DNA_END=923 /DNA_ORIENTATION=+